MCGLFQFINWMNSKNEVIFLMTNQVYCFNTRIQNLKFPVLKQYYLLISFTKKYKTFSLIFQRLWAISLKMTLFCVTCTVSNVFFQSTFWLFLFFYCCSLMLNSLLVSSLKCHTSPHPNPWWAGGRDALLSGDQYKDCKGFYVH